MDAVAPTILNSMVCRSCEEGGMDLKSKRWEGCKIEAFFVA